jgi:hypothetical protein
MIVLLTVEQLAQIIESAVTRVLARQRPTRLQYDTKETAVLLNVKPSWLSNQVRARAVPFHRHPNGHRIFFTHQDVEQILAQSAVAADPDQSPKPGRVRPPR